MLDPCDFDNWASCVLCCCAKNAIAKYVSCGFSITELDDFDVGPVSAGMFWMTIDDDVFHINFFYTAHRTHVRARVYRSIEASRGRPSNRSIASRNTFPSKGYSRCSVIS